MRIQYRLITFALMVCSLQIRAQSGIDNVLSSIASNNKTLMANTQFWDAQKAGYKTGLSPSNPVLGFDYLIGSPAAAGNQTDLTITQSLDFPTVYARKGELADLKIDQAQWQVLNMQREILLKAKNLCIDLVYHRRLQTQLDQRLAHLDRLQIDFQSKLDKGDGKILDLHKARIEYAKMKKVLQENLASINSINAQLTSLNGGNPLQFRDSTYTISPTIPSFEILEQETEDADPMRSLLEQKIAISDKSLQVSKALKLPKIEVGYHYQGILGQFYNGLHTGLSLPLWENKNTTEAREAEIMVAKVDLQDHRNTHYYEVKEDYDQYIAIGAMLEDYRKLLREINSEGLLLKSLELGNISVIEYFQELGYYYDAEDHQMELEHSYHLIIAALLKYQLG
jgi:outer membrane protein TolC